MKNPSSDDQKDLFPVQQESERTHSESVRTFFRLKSNPLISVSLEQVFVTLIVLTILFVLVFMMGVLRGRTLKQQMEGAAPATAVIRPPVGAQTPASLKEQNVVRIAPAAPVETPLANTAKKPYTIQLVTYRNEDRALKEIADLRARGLQPNLIRRSGYFEICVGQYADRKEAQKDLRTLANRYKGCYLRKI